MFGERHDILIAYDRAIRDYRCRQRTQGPWTLQTDVSHPEQHILHNHVMMHISNVGNSTAPGKAPPGAAGERVRVCPKFKRTGKCSLHEAGKCPHKHPEGMRKKSRAIPKDFYDKHIGIRPPICLQFAYHGTCPNNPSGDSCERGGQTYRHVCHKCEFKNGKHPIKEGTGC